MPVQDQALFKFGGTFYLSFGNAG